MNSPRELECPAIGDWVVWRRPLSKVEIEFMEKDAKAYPPIPKLYPLLVLHSDKVWVNDEHFVRVTGYVIKPPLPGWSHELGGGILVKRGPQPQADWIEDVEGPSPAPGHWNWKTNDTRWRNL